MKREVVAKLNKGVKLDGKSDEYVSAAFEILTAQKAAVNPLTEAAKQSTSTTKSDGLTVAEMFRQSIYGRK